MRKLDLHEVPPLIDLPVDARISAPKTLGRGYRPYERYEISLQPGSIAIERDVLRSGPVVGVLPIDVRRDQVVLIRQFRLGGHISLGRGAMIEVPAGRVGPQETADQAACRECHEEIGVYPIQLHPLFDLVPAPALSDERMTLYAALIDAARVKARGGCVEEQEDIETIRISIDAALLTMLRGGFHNSTVIIALQWLALNRKSLPGLFGSASA